MMNFRTMARFARAAGLVAAAVASAGATIGFYEMTENWLVAGLFGVGVASILGLGWHLLIGAAENARRNTGRAFLVIAGALLVGIAISTSGWSLVTAVGGHSALKTYHVEALTAAEEALNASHNRIEDQRALVNNVRQSATASELLGAEEGRSGQGPLYRSYMRTAENMNDIADTMLTTMDEADETYEAGLAAVGRAHASLGNENEFRAAMADISRLTTILNGYDVTQQVLEVGMVGLNDRNQPQLSPITEGLYEAAESVNTETVDVPPYVAISKAEAVALYGDKVVSAWIAAIAIDAAPFLFLLLIMFMAPEPLMREPSDPKRRTDDEIREAENNVIGFAPKAAQPAE